MSDVETSAVYERAQEMRAEEIQTGKDMDTELRAVYERMNGPEAQEKEFLANPPMPNLPADSSESDLYRANYDWNKTPLEDRQNIAKVQRGLSEMKSAADYLGLKVETAADLKAAREIINQESGINPKPDPEMQSSLEIFRTVVPFAKDHREAATHLNEWAKAIRRDPVTGWRSLLEAQGVRVADLLTPQELQHFGGMQQPQETDNSYRTVVDAWAQRSGLSQEDLSAMGDLVASPGWKHIPDENVIGALERAQKALARSRTRQAQHKASGDKLDQTLRTIANRAYAQ